MMDQKQRLREIADFLKPYQRIWQNEIMLSYPTPFADYNSEWVEEMASFKRTEDILRIGKKDISELNLSSSLRSYYQRIEELTAVDQQLTAETIPHSPHMFLYMIPKKQHEIRRLAPFLNKTFKDQKCDSVIDIGGGIGFLAQTLANQYDLPTTSLDMDPILQATGRDRHKKNSKVAANKVNYKNIKVAKDELAFCELLNPNVMTVGLHTCGKLAVDHLEASTSKKVKCIVNFGCCYFKLMDFDGQNLSNFAQSLENKVEMGQFALTLSARAHRKMDAEDFDFKLMVKKFRYAIHFLLKDEYGRTEMDNLGNSHPSLYGKPFAEYALEQLTRLKLQPKHTECELNSYFKQTHLQELIWKMQSATLLRDALGRVLEMYLLLDRAIYLDEQGYQSHLLEFFDESISPRNLGIVGTLKRKNF